ncbi:MAG: sensor histidine kinase [Eubacteriales bacterium]|nr:sensor histidine kinase [Eubacteriales bacterium]
MKKRIFKRPWTKKVRSIQSEVFLMSAMLVLVAVITITYVSVRVTRTSILDNSTTYTKQILDQMNHNLGSYVNYMDNIASIVAESENTQEYLFRENETRTEINQILEQFSIILKGRADILNLGIVKDRGAAIINDAQTKINTNIDIEKLDWYRKAKIKPGRAIISSSHVQHIIEGSRPWVITLSRGIRSKTNHNETGVFFIDLNYNAISELCDQNTLGENGYVFIMDQNGNIVYHPQQQQLYNELQSENTESILNSQEDTVVVGKGANEKRYTISRLDQTGWVIVGCVYTKELLRDSDNALKIYTILAISLIVAALLVSMLIAKGITTPIQQLRHSMEQVQEGDFSAGDIQTKEQNEIGSLTNSFRVMTRRIEELMEQNVHEQEEKRKSELRALQSQINPHFLYNTLDSIIWMAEGKKNEEVVLMTSSLARLLRQSISNEEELVTIGQETEYAKSYLTIMKMRYKDKLEYSIQVDPSVNRIHIIKLVLQPIIENAIYHGVKYKESQGNLEITGYLDGMDAVIRISDDGVGMDENTLQHIFEKHKVNYQSNGVGIYNVQKRLELYYGSGYGLTYKSEPGKGTTVEIRIPAGGGANETK